MRYLKIMADYGCDPLWYDHHDTHVGCINPRELPISEALIADLNAWQAIYDSLLDVDDPTNSPEPPSTFDNQGRNLARRLRAELGDEVQVRYWRD